MHRCRENYWCHSSNQIICNIILIRRNRKYRQQYSTVFHLTFYFLTTPQMIKWWSMSAQKDEASAGGTITAALFNLWDQHFDYIFCNRVLQHNATHIYMKRMNCNKKGKLNVPCVYVWLPSSLLFGWAIQGDGICHVWPTPPSVSLSAIVESWVLGSA